MFVRTRRLVLAGPSWPAISSGRLQRWVRFATTYCLGITNIDPLKYGLIFERFFYEERITPPDIDLDFEDYRRGEVIEYCRERYGTDHVAQIITFGTLGSKVAIRDVCRAMSVPIPEADRLSKLIPTHQGKAHTIDKALEEVPELSELYQSDGRVKEVLDTAKAIEGLSRHSGVHAAAVVITPGPVSDYCPVQRLKDGGLVTKYDMGAVANVGLLKMDFLGLRTLTVVEQCVRLMKENHPEVPADFDVDDAPMNDRKVFRLLQTGNCAGVFQLESSGMCRLVVDIKPTRFEDIIPLVALYRPGPLGNGDTERFIKRRGGAEPTVYLHEALQPYLRDTCGIFVYQDQILQIAMQVAGFCPKDADDLLRAMSKKKLDKMQSLKPAFIAGVAKKTIDEESALKIWEAMESFAAYGFDKDHSGAYAMLTYQTACLKANYPVEFMTALLTSISDNADKIAVYIDECKRTGISVELPSVNQSGKAFTVYKAATKTIRFGLLAIHGIGDKPIDEVLQARGDVPFTDLIDFCRRIDSRRCPKSAVDAMIRGGAFDALHDRAQALAGLEIAFAESQRMRKDRLSGQVSFFEEAPNVIERPTLPDVAPMTERERLALDIENTNATLLSSQHRGDRHRTEKEQKWHVVRRSKTITSTSSL